MSDQPYSTARIRVLLVDDELSLLDPMTAFLGRYFTIVSAVSGKTALELVKTYHGEFDVALIDESLMPGPSGIEVMKKIRAQYPNIEVIIFTGWGQDKRQNALRSGAFRYLEKPVNKEELVLLIRSAAQQVRFRAINRDMLASRGLNGLQEAILKAVCSLVFADDAAMVFTNPITGEQVIRRSKAAETAKPRVQRHLQHTSITAEIIQSGELVSIPDTEADPRVDQLLKVAGYRSFIGLPIPGESGTQGALYVYSKDSHHFDELGHTALLRTIAYQAGLALTNGWAEERLKLHNQYMVALVRASRELSAARSQKEMFEIAWRFVNEILGISIFYIALFDETSGVLSFPLYYDLNVPIVRPPRTLESRDKWGVTGYVINTAEEVFWPNPADEEKYCQDKQISVNISGTHSKSCFFYPLIIDNRAGGVISVQSQKENGLPALYLDALRALGNHLCVAIKNNRLQSEETQRRLEAEALHMATQAISKSIEPGSVIPEILKTMRSVVPFDYATVHLLRTDGDQEVFEMIDGAGFPEIEKRIGTTYPVDGRETYRQVYQQRHTVIIPNVNELKEDPVRRARPKEGIHSWMGVPLLVDNDLIGIITVNSKQSGFYTDRHAALAEVFATGVAQAVSNAQHHEEIQHTNRLLNAVTLASWNIRSEEEPQRLLFETVHQAADLLQFPYGALFYYNQYLQELELTISYHLPESLNGIRFPASLSLAGTATVQEDTMNLPGEYQQHYPLDPILAGMDIRAALAVPITHPNDPETQRVLLLADEHLHEVSEADLEVLERLIDQAAIAIRTSTFISGEKNRLEQLTILQKIYEFIQTRRELDDILHLILTGITAGYGLGFNRAILFEVDYLNNCMVGKMAIGCLDAESANAAWDESRKAGLDSFARYLKSLNEKTLAPTPLHTAIVGKSFANPGGQFKPFIEMLEQQRSLCFEPAELAHIPDFVRIFQPTSKMVIVPLVVAEELTGVILVDNKFHMAPITTESESALITFANIASSAIENDRLLNTLQRTRDAAVNVTKVAALGNLNESLAIIRKNARQVLKCDMFTLYIYDAKTRKFTGLEHYGCDDEAHIRPPNQLRPSSSPYKVIQLPAPNFYLTRDSQHDEYFQGDFALGERIKATLAVKLVFQDVPVGALFINYRSAHKFSPDEINTALLFGQQAAIAIQNARLYSRVEQQTKYLEQLYEAGKAIAASLSMQDTLQILAERARQLTAKEGCQECFCNVLLEEQGLLHITASDPVKQQYIDKQTDTHGIPCGMTGRAFLSGKSQVAGDVRKHPDYLELDPDTRSELVVPLKVGEKVIGVINLENHCLGAFDEVDKSNLELLAAQASIAIQNAQAYDELRKAQGIIAARTALAWTGMSASIWRHSIEKDAITIRDQAGLLRMNLDKLPALPLFGKEKVIERVGMVERLAKHILSKPITTPLSSEEGIETVLVNSLVKERVTQLWERPDYPPATYQLDFVLGDEISMLASPEWLRRALDVLVENAVREARQCQDKKVIIGTRPAERGQLEIYVRDAGRGIPADTWNILGEESIPRAPGSESMGLGLLMAQIIATTYGGSLVKISTGPDGTEIGLRLPIQTTTDKKR